MISEWKLGACHTLPSTDKKTLKLIRGVTIQHFDSNFCWVEAQLSRLTSVFHRCIKLTLTLRSYFWDITFTCTSFWIYHARPFSFIFSISIFWFVLVKTVLAVGQNILHLNTGHGQRLEQPSASANCHPDVHRYCRVGRFPVWCRRYWHPSLLQTNQHLFDAKDHRDFVHISSPGNMPCLLRNLNVASLLKGVYILFVILTNVSYIKILHLATIACWQVFKR